MIACVLTPSVSIIEMPVSLTNVMIFDSKMPSQAEAMHALPVPLCVSGEIASKPVPPRVSEIRS